MTHTPKSFALSVQCGRSGHSHSFRFFQIQVNLLHGSLMPHKSILSSTCSNRPGDAWTPQSPSLPTSGFWQPSSKQERDNRKLAPDFSTWLYVSSLSLTLLFAHVFVLTSRKLHVHETHETQGHGGCSVLPVACDTFRRKDGLVWNALMNLHSEHMASEWLLNEASKISKLAALHTLHKIAQSQWPL